MPLADIQSLILAMRSGNIPDCKIAANKYFALGGTAEFLLSELNKDESLNVGFIITMQFLILHTVKISNLNVDDWYLPKL